MTTQRWVCGRCGAEIHYEVQIIWPGVPQDEGEWVCPTGCYPVAKAIRLEEGKLDLGPPPNGYSRSNPEWKTEELS